MKMRWYIKVSCRGEMKSYLKRLAKMVLTLILVN